MRSYSFSSGVVKHLALVLLQLGRGEALGVRERLAALVLGRRAGRGGLRDFDVEAEHAVATHAERLDARALHFLRLVFGDPAVAFGGERAQLVELRAVAGRNEVAFGEEHVRRLGDRAVDQIHHGVLRREARGDAADGGNFRDVGDDLRHGAERLGERLEVARVRAPGIDLRGEALEVAHAGEARLQRGKADAVLHERLHAVEARVDVRHAPQGLADPRGETARAHRRARGVEHAEERGLARHAVHGQKREVADRARVERKEVRAFAQTHAADVPHGMAERGVHVVEQRTGGTHEVALSFKAEAVERGHVEVAQQLLLRGVERERPGVRVGDAGGRRRIVLGTRQHDLRGTQARKRVVETVLRLERLHGELAGGEVEECKAEARNRSDVGVRARVEEAVLRDRAGRHDARHLAAHDLSLLDEARVLHLVADGGGLARADELREVGVKRVVGNAAQRRAGALRERGAEDRRGDYGVLAEHLVEVAEAEHENRAGRQLALDRAILSLHGCEFFGHEEGIISFLTGMSTLFLRV